MIGADAIRRVRDVVVSPTASIAEAIAHLDRAGSGALVLCSSGTKVSGLLTDGDIRRAILRKVPLDQPCGTIASQNPVLAEDPISASEALHLMNLHDIHHLPVVDAQGNLVEFLMRKDLTEESLSHLSAVIMAGGLGRRLLPLTEEMPKPMLPVGDRPLLEHTIEQLALAGIREINLTTHHLHERIREHFGAGDAFGVSINYVNEDLPMGTAGGLKLMKRASGPFLVINGDIMTGVSFSEMLRYHRRHQAILTMGVRVHKLRVPFGVVECEDELIVGLEEKPVLRLLINAGVYLMEPSACDYIPDGRRFDMTDLLQVLLDEGQPVAGFPIIEHWQDIGCYEDYRQAQREFRRRTHLTRGNT